VASGFAAKNARQAASFLSSFMGCVSWFNAP
jgi:hypothetical protein